jgi:hypothetical protein
MLTVHSVNAVAIGAGYWYIEKYLRSVSANTTVATPTPAELNVQALQDRLEKAIAQRDEYRHENVRLEKDLDDAQATYADLRRVVQVHDVLEPKELLANFRHFNSLIERVSNKMSTCVMNCLDPEKTETSLVMKDKLGEFAPDSLIDPNITLDEFVFYLLRFHISNELYLSMTKFHPKVTDVDNLIEGCYELIRCAREC